MASSLSPKLPKCVSKTKAREISSLKKQLKEVLTHREQYKTTSADLDSRLKTCSIVKGEYDRLVDMINSANSSVDVMNRVCLTQDLKKKIDREYRELRETLESTTRSYDGKVEQLVKIVEKNKLDIEAYQSEVLSVNEENNNLREALKENANMIAGLGQQINQLQDEKLNLIEEVNVRERKIDDKNAEIEERMEVNGRLYAENNELNDNIKKVSDENRSLKSYYDALDQDHEELKEKTKVIYAELQSLEEENGVLKQRLIDGEKTIETYTNKYTDDMGEADEEIRVLQETLEQTSKKEQECEADKLLLQEDINTLRNSAENLRNNLIEEKNDCLDRVQRAIEETEGNISSRESRKYEKELTDLNGKLRLTEEALDELRKAGTLEGKKLPAKAVRKAIKKLNQAGGKV